MTALELVQQVILRATGDLYTGSFGDDDSNKVIALANPKIDAWAKEADWNSLYDPGVELGTITATDTFDLDDTIRAISDNPDDYVQIVKTDGNTVNYQTVPAQDLKRYANGNYCARIGTSLVFNKAFTADSPEFGGTLKVPAYLYPDHLVNSTDEVPVDDPNWLVAAVAADWVQLDNTLAQNRPDFLAEANDLLTGMKKANGAQVQTVVMGPVLPNLRSW